MLTYHGTTESVALLALQEGLKPRKESGRKGHWEHTVDSSTDLVYLTTAYAGYFACVASSDVEKWGILEIDLNKLPERHLRPDEDWLEQSTRHIDLGCSGMHERTKYFRSNIDEFAPLWQKSIEGLGSCAYQGTIPPEAITRAAVWDSKVCSGLAFMAIDPSIGLANYALCSSKYKALVKWLIGDTIEAHQLMFGGKEILLLPGIKEEVEELAKALGDRNGWEKLK